MGGGRKVDTFYDDSAAVGGEGRLSHTFYIFVLVELGLMLIARLL